MKKYEMRSKRENLSDVESAALILALYIRDSGAYYDRPIVESANMVIDAMTETRAIPSGYYSHFYMIFKFFHYPD